MSDERREYTPTDWLRDFLEEQGVHVKDAYLAERADDFRSLILALMDTPEEPEPVAWLSTSRDGKHSHISRMEVLESGYWATVVPLYAHPPRAEGEVVEGWAEEGINDDTELCGDSWREWVFVESNRPAPDGARRARLIIEQEGEDG